MKELIFNMDLAIRTLALELHEEVHANVSLIWQALKDELENQNKFGKDQK